jgi:hypothetical protein
VSARLALLSLDVVVDADDRCWLLEMNGARSGFDGLWIAQGDRSLGERLEATLRGWAPSDDIRIVAGLFTTGVLPRGYLRKARQELARETLVRLAHRDLRVGASGLLAGSTDVSSGLSSAGATNSATSLPTGFPTAWLDVADPTSPVDSRAVHRGPGGLLVPNHPEGARREPISKDTLLWLRCPSLAYADAQAAGLHLNDELPLDALVDDKWLFHSLLGPQGTGTLPTALLGNGLELDEEIDRVLASGAESLVVKPVVGSGARGVEVVAAKELARGGRHAASPVALALLAEGGLLAQDLRVVAPARPSRPVPCAATGRRHHGCVRAMVLVRVEGGRAEVRWLGGYWRLAAAAADARAPLRDRLVASQSQGARCVPLSGEDDARLAAFSERAVLAFLRAIQDAPAERDAFLAWEDDAWTRRVERALGPEDLGAWREARKRLGGDLSALEREVEAAGFLADPVKAVGRGRAIRWGLPRLLRRREVS